MDNTTIIYNSIQRIYRAALVHLIRSTFETSNERGIKKIQELFGKKDFSGKTYWETIKSAAEERRSGGTGELSTPIKDEYEIIGVEHFSNIFEKYFDLLCPIHASKPKKEKSQARETLLRWMKQIKNIRDPVSHPTTDDISYEDSFNALYCARKVLDFCQLPEASSQILRLQRNLVGGFFLNEERIASELPPPDEVVMEFVGRHHELAILNDWVNTRSSRRWALSGEGGKGKSAIAYAFAKSIANREDHDLQGVFWISAKRRRFVEGSTVLVDRPDFHNKETSISAILGFFGIAPEDAREEDLFDLLTNSPSLLIVDDIDTVETEGEDAIQFLLMTIPERTNSLVLVTSRRAIFGMANVTTQVTGLSPQDAEDFIKSRCHLMGIFPGSVLEYKEKLLEVTDASPLFLEDLLRLSQAGFSIEKAIGLWANKRGNEAREYAIRREYDQLSDDAKQILLALSVYGPCDSDLLCQGLDWDEERLLDTLQQLRKMFLMPGQQLVGGKQEFILGKNTQILVKDVFSSTQAYRRVERLMKAAAGRLQTTNSEDQKVSRILKRARTLVFQNHDLEQAEQLIEDTKNQYPGRSDLYAILAWIQRKNQDYASARMNFRRAHDLGTCNADAYWHWSEMEALNNEWNSSADAALLGIEKYPEDKGLLFRIGYALQRQGKELCKDNDLENGLKSLRKAGKYLERALDHDNLDRRNYTLKSKIFRSIALNIEALEIFSDLPTLFSRWEKECPDDYYMDSERERLSQKCPELVKNMNCD